MHGDKESVKDYILKIKGWLDSPVFQTAFIHRSYLNESNLASSSNERLEFLGDSILSFVISIYLYNERAKDTEGDLTNLRSYIVKTHSLAKAAKELDLGSLLKMSKGEELSGGRENPQLLANTYESLLGAIYLERGIEEVEDFLHTTLLPLFKNELKSGPPKDSKSLLQEVIQNKTKLSPKYQILKTTGPDHNKEFTVGVFIQTKQVGQGKGFSKQIAEEAAASDALAKIQESL